MINPLTDREEGSCLQAPSHLICNEKRRLIPNLFEKAYPVLDFH